MFRIGSDGFNEEIILNGTYIMTKQMLDML